MNARLISIIAFAAVISGPFLAGAIFFGNKRQWWRCTFCAGAFILLWTFGPYFIAYDVKYLLQFFH